MEIMVNIMIKRINYIMFITIHIEIFIIIIKKGVIYII